MRIEVKPAVVATVPIVLLFFPAAAHAYVGPGGIISGIGALLALIAALFVAVLGFVWFPLKRLMTWFRSRRGPASGEAAVPSLDSSPN